MTDVHSPEIRSKNMRAIRSMDSQPEKLVRRFLHSQGFRFRLHESGLPGKPDIVLAKHRAVIFVHGCFWHRHKCHLFKWPKANPEFWRTKITNNHRRDKKTVALLVQMGWRVLVIWECALKNRSTDDVEAALDQVTHWIRKQDGTIFQIAA